MSVVSQSFAKGHQQPDGSFWVTETVTDDVSGTFLETFLAAPGTTDQQIADHLAARATWVSARLQDEEFKGATR